MKSYNCILYKRLQKQLADKKICKADLRKVTSLALTTMTKLRKGKPGWRLYLEKSTHR